MLKRTIIFVSLTLALLGTVEPLQTVHGIVMTKVEVMVTSVSATMRGEDSQEKQGNAFVRALKAPFKAIGRLFGRRKKDDNKLHRLSQDDVKKFEAAPVTRITNAQTVLAATESVDGTTLTPGLAPTIGTELPTIEQIALEHLERGRELLQTGNLNDAIDILSRAASLNPKLKDAHNLLGVAYEQKGLPNFARQSFEAALRGENDDPQHLNNLGYFLYKNGDYDGAIKHLKRAVKLAPNDQRFLNNLGLAQAQRGKFDDAYKSFARAGGEFDGRMNIASRLQRQGFDKEAIKHLEKARAMQPSSLEIVARLITLYDRTGKYEEAMNARTSLVALRELANLPTR